MIIHIYRKEIIAHMENEFKPQKLTAELIHTIYTNSLWQNEENDYLHSFLIRGDRSTLRRFDKKELLSYQQTIKYLLGQLRVAHIGKTEFLVPAIIEAYDRTLWAKENLPVIELLHLCSCLRITHAVPSGTQDVILFHPLTPTLSPDDPNFEQWYNEHRAEWEE